MRECGERGGCSLGCIHSLALIPGSDSKEEEGKSVAKRIFQIRMDELREELTEIRYVTPCSEYSSREHFRVRVADMLNDWLDLCQKGVRPIPSGDDSLAFHHHLFSQILPLLKTIAAVSFPFCFSSTVNLPER